MGLTSKRSSKSRFLNRVQVDNDFKVATTGAGGLNVTPNGVQMLGTSASVGGSLQVGGPADALATPADRGDLARLLADKFAEAFDEDTVAILPGVRGSDFTTLPFDPREALADNSIILVPTLVDIAGLNQLSERILANAAGAIAGMTTVAAGFRSTLPRRPVVGATMYGVTTPCVEAARAWLEDHGYEVLVFHATGAGGRTLESLAADGLLAGVLDVTTTEIADELVGQYPDKAGARRGAFERDKAALRDIGVPIEQEIVPRLEQRLPVQADREELEADPLRHRFTLVFDREGYSPEFLRRMKKQRIACLTYHKFPGEDWSEEEFAPAQVRLPSGEVLSMDLAERGTCLSNGLWVRELRKRSERGHQTAILCTDYRSEAAPLALAMFARWSQENFFKYAREHFSLDRLVDYRTEVISDPLQVVNPDYRQLDGQVRSATGKLTRRLAKFAAMTLDEPIEPKHVEPFVRRKAALQEEIETLQHELEALKAKRKETPHHITVDELPQEARFRQLSTQSKQLVDTIKMVAYRAETAMANSLREHLTRPDEARRLLTRIRDGRDPGQDPEPSGGGPELAPSHFNAAARREESEPGRRW